MTAELLPAVRRDYDEVARLRAALDDLRTVEQARAEYEAHRADLATRLGGLARLRKPAPPPPTGPREDGPAADGPVEPARPAERSTPPPMAPPPPAARADAGARRELMKAARRWHAVWDLSPEALGRINRLADDPTRPLGEALALLPWAAFADDRQAGRLAEWAAALAEYREHLAREVELAELHAGTWLGVWRLWKGRGAAWEACLAGGRRELEAKIAEVERAVLPGERGASVP